MATLDDLDLETLDFGSVQPEEFARIVKALPARRIAELMGGAQRRRVLDEVFGRMHTRFRPEAAAGKDVLIRWSVTDGDGAADVYETRLADGACTVIPERTDREPQLSLAMEAPEFLKLVSGNTSGPALFFTRKLKLKGDIRVAGALTYYFDIPKV